MYKGIEITLKLMLKDRTEESLNYLSKTIKDCFTESVLTPLSRVLKIILIKIK